MSMRVEVGEVAFFHHMEVRTAQEMDLRHDNSPLFQTVFYMTRLTRERV